jgi:hypothetical protein
MLFLDVLYIALATIGIMVLLQLITFVGAKLLYPPEPKIIYRDRDAPVAPRVIEQPQFTVPNNYLPATALVAPPPNVPYPRAPAQAPAQAPEMIDGKPVLPAHLQAQDPRGGAGNGNGQAYVGAVSLPEYEPPVSSTTSARVDTKLPAGLQPVNPRDL